MVVSEVGIMALIISQTLILVFQDPNLLYWVFLVLSLILQISVVAASEPSEHLFKSCVKKAILLKGYAVLVLILQIGFKLIND